MLVGKSKKSANLWQFHWFLLENHIFSWGVVARCLCTEHHHNISMSAFRRIILLQMMANNSQNWTRNLKKKQWQNPTPTMHDKIYQKISWLHFHRLHPVYIIPTPSHPFPSRQSEQTSLPECPRRLASSSRQSSAVLCLSSWWEVERFHHRVLKIKKNSNH